MFSRNLPFEERASAGCFCRGFQGHHWQYYSLILWFVLLVHVWFRKEFSCLNLKICLWSKGGSLRILVNIFFRVCVCVFIVKFLFFVYWDNSSLTRKEWIETLLGWLCTMVCSVRDGHCGNILISRKAFCFFDFAFVLPFVIFLCWLSSLNVYWVLHLHHSKPPAVKEMGENSFSL